MVKNGMHEMPCAEKYNIFVKKHMAKEKILCYN